MRPTIQIIVRPAGRDYFRAMLGDRVLAEGLEPVQAAARVLLDEKVDPATPLVCRRIGRGDERSTVGAVAGPKATRRAKLSA
jgi:hypothetical protein